MSGTIMLSPRPATHVSSKACRFAAWEISTACTDKTTSMANRSNPSPPHPSTTKPLKHRKPQPFSPRTGCWDSHAARVHLTIDPTLCGENHRARRISLHMSECDSCRFGLIFTDYRRLQQLGAADRERENSQLPRLASPIHGQSGLMVRSSGAHDSFTTRPKRSKMSTANGAATSSAGPLVVDVKRSAR